MSCEKYNDVCNCFYAHSSVIFVGLGNGMAPNRRQAIARNNDDQVDAYMRYPAWMS